MGVDGGVRARLQEALTVAMKSRDRNAASALRSALAAIANAEAAPGAERADGVEPAAVSEHVAGAAAGVGATEVARRSLDESEVTAVVEQEIAERAEAAEGYDRLGRSDDARALRREIDLLRSCLG